MREMVDKEKGKKGLDYLVVVQKNGEEEKVTWEKEKKKLKDGHAKKLKALRNRALSMKRNSRRPRTII